MKVLSLAVLIGALVSGCGGSSSPSSPSSPSPVTSTSLSGSWTGTSADSTGQEQMTWAVTQNGSSMTGSMSFADSGRNMMGNGAMQGTINGRNVTFHMEVPNGGFSGVMSPCSMLVDGQATLSDDGRTITGTYSGSMSGMMTGGMMGRSCGGTMSNGHFTLTR